MSRAEAYDQAFRRGGPPRPPVVVVISECLKNTPGRNRTCDLVSLHPFGKEIKSPDFSVRGCLFKNEKVHPAGIEPATLVTVHL